VPAERIGVKLNEESIPYLILLDLVEVLAILAYCEWLNRNCDDCNVKS